MISKTMHKIIAVLFVASLLAPFALTRAPALAHLPTFALKDPCALDPNNLITNGSMAGEHGTSYGSLAEAWEPFIFDGAAPKFRWVSNEQIDPNGSQQIYSSGTFDAGIYQTVRNLQPNVYYWIRLGYSLAAKWYGGPNVRVDSIGRKVGIDPFGGTDPKSPNVIWGPDLFDGNAALNRPEMTMIFAARADRATIFLRAMARDGSSGENRVWLDAVCMEARYDMPTATPLPPTATPVPPTATPRPTQARAPAPKIAQVQNTPAATLAPTVTPTATPTETPLPTGTPRYARPLIAPEPDSPVELGAGMFVGAGALLIAGAVMFFGFGLVLWRKMG
jgi:hypothetical protein